MGGSRGSWIPLVQGLKKAEVPMTVSASFEVFNTSGHCRSLSLSVLFILVPPVEMPDRNDA